MSEQPGLFDLPNVAPLAKPKKATRGEGPIRYTDYRVKVPVRCMDCAQVAYETLSEGRLNAPPMRSARFKRTQGSSVLLLCSAHKNLRQQDEAEPARKSG